MNLAVLLLFCILSEVSCTKKEEWNQFKLHYKKTYGTRREDRLRFKIFKNNLREIKAHNRKYDRGRVTFEKGINGFADRTEEEFSNFYNIFKTDHTIMYNFTMQRNKSSVADNETEHVDWREQGAVTPVKDQGACGACWIFSGVGVLESYHFRKTGHLVRLSEQNVVDCFSNSTCDGGFPEDTLSFVKEYGINAEADYPYRAKYAECKSEISNNVNITFNSVEQVGNSEDELKVAVTKYGPIAVCLYVTSRWRFYKRGVWYDRECSEQTNHCMLLVGYGRENGRDYWLIKNSWGKDWGEDGYIKVARNMHENYCGLTNESFYIT